MTEIKVCSFPPDAVLDQFEQQLGSMGVSYRIEPHSDRQDLFVDDRQLDAVTALLNGMARSKPSISIDAAKLKSMLMGAPLTYGLVLASCLIYIVDWVLGPRSDLLPYLSFTQVKVFLTYTVSSDLSQTFLQDNQWWRMVTPIFIHGGLVHLVFNCAATIEFGRRLESSLPKSMVLLVIVIAAIGSNFAQYWATKSAFFGGLSGVVFALFGLLVVLFLRTRHPIFHLPRAFIVVVSISLLMGPLGVFESLFGVSIADYAHFAGLFIGGIFGLLIPYQITNQSINPQENYD